MRFAAMLLVGLLSFPVAGSAQKLDRDVAEELTNLSDSFEELVAAIGPAVVQIFAVGYGAVGSGSTTQDLLGRRRSSGSGVILDSNGYIITNAHVVSGARRLQVVLPDDDPDKLRAQSILKPKRRRVGAQIVGIDAETDLAVIKVAAKGLPYLVLGDSDAVRQGQIVLAFGSPYGLQNSVSMGVVSSMSRQLSPDSPMIYIQTDATINPGNSGGPLVDTSGNVVGINTMIFSQAGGSEGVGFAAPSNIVKNIYNQFRTSGRVRRGHIGVHAQTITPTMADALGLDRDWGVIIGDVYPGGPGDVAGLKVGDIVQALDGKPMENGRQLDINIYRHSVGDEVTLEVVRAGQLKMIPVSIVERDDDVGRFAELVKPERNLIPKLGVLCLDIDSSVERMLPSMRLRPGVLVAARAADAPYGDGGLMAGDVIHTINGQHVDNLTQLQEIVARISSGGAVACLIERGGRLMFIAFEIGL